MEKREVLGHKLRVLQHLLVGRNQQTKPGLRTTDQGGPNLFSVGAKLNNVNRYGGQLLLGIVQQLQLARGPYFGQPCNKLIRLKIVFNFSQGQRGKVGKVEQPD